MVWSVDMGCCRPWRRQRQRGSMHTGCHTGSPTWPTAIRSHCYNTRRWDCCMWYKQILILEWTTCLYTSFYGFICVYVRDCVQVIPAYPPGGDTSAVRVELRYSDPSGIVDFCVTGSEPASVIWTLADECSAFCVQRECVFILRGRYVLWGGTQGTPTLVGVWSGWPGGLLTVRWCATQDCVIVYWEDVDDSCVKCIHVCLWISVISLDPLGLSWINLLTLYYKHQQNVFSPFTLWRNLISRNRNVKKISPKWLGGLPSPPLPSSL